MSDNFNIRVDIDFDWKSANINLNKLLKKLQKENKLDIIIDQKKFETIENEFNKLKQKLEKNKIDINFGESQLTNVNSDLDKFSKKMIEVNGTFQTSKQMAQWSDGVGNVIKLTEALNTKTGEVVGRTKEVTDNYKQQRKEQEKLAEVMAKGREKSTLRFQKEALELEEQQAKAINRNLELEYKRQQAEENRLRKLGQLKGQIDKNMFGDDTYLKEQIQNLYGADTIISKYKRTLDGLGNSQVKLAVQTQTSNNKFHEFDIVVDKTTNKIYQLSESIKNSNSRMVNMAIRMNNSIKEGIAFASTVGLMYKAINKLKESIDFTINLQNQLTQVRMLQNLTSESTRSMAKEFNKLGDDLAITTKELSEINTALIRQGLSAEVSAERMVEISKVAKITGVSVEEVTKTVTAGANALKNMGVSIQEYNDILVLAGSISASSYGEISDALNRVIGMADTVGVSATKLTAYSSTLSELFRGLDSSMLGTGMRAIFARFNKINEETGELNKDLNKVQTALESVGIEFLDVSGNIRPVEELLDSLGDKWISLSKNQKMYVSTQVAGTRHISTFMGLMDNYNRVLELNSDLMDASGTVNSQYSIYLSELGSSIQRLANAFQTLYTNSINSGFLKLFVDGTTSVIKFIDKVGALKLAVFALSNIMLFGSKNFQVFANSLAQTMLSMDISKIKSFSGSFSLLPHVFRTTNAQGVVTAQTMLWLGRTFDLLKVKTALLQGALTMGLSFAITGIISGITKLISKNQEAIQKQKEFYQAMSQKFPQINEVQKLIDEYNELKNKTNKTVEEETRLLEIHNSLAQQFPDVISETERYGVAVDNNIDKLKELNEEQLKYYENELLSKQDSAKAEIKRLEEKEKELEEKVRHYEERVKNRDFSSTMVAGGYKIELSDENNKELQFLNDSLSKYNIELQETSDKLEEQEKILSEYHKIQQMRIKDILDETNAEKMSKEQKDDLIESLQSQKYEIEDINTVLDTYNNLTEESFIEVNAYKQTLASISDEMKEYSDTTNDAVDKHKLLSDALQELIDNGYISVDTMEKLREAYGNTLGSIELTEEGLKSFIKSDKELTDSTIKNSIRRTQQVIEDTKKQVTSLQNLVDAITGVHGVRLMADLDEDVNNAIIKQQKEKLQAYKDQMAEAKANLVELENTAKRLSNIDREVKSGSGSGGGSSLTDFIGSSSDKFQSKIESLNSELDKTDTKLSNISQEISNLEKADGDNYDTMLKKRNELLDEQLNKQSLINTQIEKNKSLQNQIKQGIYDNFSNLKGVDISNFTKSDFENYNPYAGLIKNDITQEERQAYENGQALWESHVNGLLNAREQLKDLNGKKITIIGDIVDTKTSIKSIEEEKLRIVEEIQNQIIDVIRRTYEDERDEALDTIDEISKKREKAHNQRIKELEEEKQKQTDVYDDLIDQIDRAESKHDYDNEQRKLLNDKASLQKQYNMLLGDNSREAQAQREELRRKIDDIDYQINESAHDREIELRKQSILDSKEAYQKKMDDKIEKANEEYEIMREELELERKTTEEFYEDKLEQSNLYLEAQRKLLDGSFKDLSITITEHLNKFGDGLSVMGNSIKTNVIDKLETVKGLLDEINIKNNMNVSSSLGTSSISTPELVTTNSVVVQVDKLVNIEGNADSSSVSKIENAGRGSLASLERALKDKGIRLR